MNGGQRRRRQHGFAAVGMRRLPQPQLAEHLARQVRRVAADDHAVVVGRILLHLVQRRGRAAAAFEHVGELRRGAVERRRQRLPRRRRLVHGAAREVGDLLGHLHPVRGAALVAGVGAGHGKAVGDGHGHRVVVEDTAEPVRARPAEVAVPAAERQPRLHADVGRGRRLQRGRDTAERGQRGERRDAAAAVVAEAQPGGVRRDAPWHGRHGPQRARERRRPTAAARGRQLGHHECAGLDDLRERDRGVGQRHRGQPLTGGGRGSRGLREHMVRHHQQRQCGQKARGGGDGARTRDDASDSGPHGGDHTQAMGHGL